jgi:predicted nucleic acid-binding Zn ribbon protein
MSNIVRHREVAPEAAHAPLGNAGETFGQRTCCLCGRPLRGRQEKACSGRCRAAWSRRQKVQAVAKQDRQIRVLLTEALRLLGGTGEGGG